MQIILVEDNQGDIFLIKKTLKEMAKDLDLKTITDGAEAISCITSDGGNPDLIILDINLPHHNGFQILEAIKNTKEKKGYSSSNFYII